MGLVPWLTGCWGEVPLVGPTRCSCLFEVQLNVWSWPAIRKPQVLGCLGYKCIVTILTELF